MDLKTRLHDYFYKKTYAATDHVAGRHMFKMAAPLLRKIFPAEKTARTPEEVLSEMGYDPSIFGEDKSCNIHVFERNLTSLLALGGIVGNALTLKEAFSPHMDAVAFPNIGKDDGPHYILLNSGRDYASMLATISTIPEKYLGDLQGNPALSEALTLGHEMRHFDMPPTYAKKPARYVEIESYCDIMPILDFHNASSVDRKELDATAQELIHARAVGPILVALRDKNKLDDSVFGHATALMILHPELAQQDNAGKTVIQAYKDAREILMRYIDYEDFTPRIIQSYSAAKEALERENFQNPWAKKAIEHFVEGYEYLSPELVKKARPKYHKDKDISPA